MKALTEGYKPVFGDGFPGLPVLTQKVLEFGQSVLSILWEPHNLKRVTEIQDVFSQSLQETEPGRIAELQVASVNHHGGEFPAFQVGEDTVPRLSHSGCVQTFGKLHAKYAVL